MENKERFINIARSIQKEGIDKLLESLEKTDFYKAPASTKYHGNYEGGLLEHSLNVYDYLSKSECLVDRDKKEDSIKIVSLFHDLCKVNLYTTQMRNVKNENGVWEKIPYYTIRDDRLALGHGEQSIYILMKYIDLTDEEASAINWHMGGFDLRVKSGSYDLSIVYSKYPLALELHLADMRATYLTNKIV